jgi:hypothetical protein
MSVQLLDLPSAAPERTEPVAVILRQCLGGRWLLEMPGYWTRGTFVGLKEALAFARRECCGAAATVELRFGAMLRVVHQPRGWPKRIFVGAAALGAARDPAPARRTLFDRLRRLVRDWLGGTGDLRPSL